MKTLITTILKTFAVAAILVSTPLFAAEAASFDSNPSDNTGIASIIEGSCSNCGGQNSSVSININEPGDSATVTVFTDFMAARGSSQGITNARGVYATKNTSNQSGSNFDFNVTLKGSNASSISDSARVTGLPSSYSIEFITGHIENEHGGADGCHPDYDYNVGTTNALFGSGGQYLGDLATDGNSWCAQGTVAARYRITNTESVVIVVDPVSTYSWETGNYGSCTGNPSTKYRDVYCVEDQSGNEVNDSNCTGTEPVSSTTVGCTNDSIPDDLDVDTDNATNVGTTTATLNGEVQSGDTNGVFFVLSDDNNFSCTSSDVQIINVSANYPLGTGDNFSYNVPANSFLQSGTDYWYRACANVIGSSEIAEGAIKPISTDNTGTSGGGDVEPVAETEQEDDVDENSAELNGNIDMNDFNDGDVFYVWGQDQSDIEDVSDENRYADVDEDGDNIQKEKVEDDFDGDDNFPLDVDGLDTDETYYYRICVEYRNNDNDDVLECGNVERFDTDDNGSNNNNNNNNVAIATLLPNSVTQTTAEMCGDLEEDGGSSQQTWIQFRTANGAFTSTPSAQRNEGNWCTRVTGLTPNTTYLYRACTPSGCAPTRTFRTQGSNTPTGIAPVISTLAPSNFGSNSATLNSFYSVNAPSGTCWFNYGNTQALGKRSSGVYQTGSGTGSCTHNFTGLKSNTQYCVQAEIRTQYGTDTGSTQCFTTPRAVVNTNTNTNTTTTTVVRPPVVTIVEEDETEVDLLSLGLGLSLVRLEIEDNKEVTTKGEVIEYEITWENISQIDLEDLDLKITIPSEVQITDTSRGRVDAAKNSVYYNIDDLREGEDGRLVVTGLVTNGLAGNILSSEAELAYNNSVNDAQENAKDFDFTTYGAQIAPGLTASVFGLANITLLGWLVILLGLFIIFLVARWLYLEREELRAQAYVGGYNTPYGGNNIAAPRYDNGYAQPQAPMYRDPAPRFDAPQAPMAQAPQDNYQPYQPNR